MSNTNDECQFLKDQLELEEQTLRDLQFQLQFAEDPSEIRNLNREISDTRRFMSELRARIRVACAPGHVPPNIVIGGIEQTQATQFFRSRLDPCPDRPGTTGRCPDNAIPLVAGKTTVLRAYAGTSASPTKPITELTGVLETRPVGSGSWQVPLTPFNAPIDPRRATSISRAETDHTLNFRIPAARCHGSLQIRVTAFDAGHPGEAGFTSASVLRTLSFTETEPLKIRLVRIRYENEERDFDLDPPSSADFWTTAEFTLRTYPTAEIQLLEDSVELYDGDFTSFFGSGGAGAQGTTGAIFDILQELRDLEAPADDVHYVALIPGGAANQTGASGWAVSRRQIVEVFDGPTMAQEFGHPRGFPGHATTCNGAPNPDPNYPDYEDYPEASIGEFGFDIVTGDVPDPATHRDFMSYCGPAWVSPYTYEGLLRNLRATRAAPVNRAAAQAQAIRELLFVSCTVFRGGPAEIHLPAFHFPGRTRAQNGIATPYSVELLDIKGRALESQRLLLDDPHRTLDDAVLDFSVAIPWHVEAAQVVVKRGGQTLENVDVEKRAPTVKLTASAQLETASGQVPIRWRAGAGDKAVSMLRYSNDGGASWIGLATNLATSEFEVDFDELPGGKRCLLQVLVSGGVRTAVATSEPFAVAIKPRRALIVAPESGAVVLTGRPVRLLGAADSPGGSGEADALSWRSSIDGHLGTGALVVAESLSIGRHRITLCADDGCGGESDADIMLTVRPQRIGPILGQEFEDQDVIEAELVT